MSQVHIVMHELGGGKSRAEDAFEDEQDALAIAGRDVGRHVVSLEVHPSSRKAGVRAPDPR